MSKPRGPIVALSSAVLALLQGSSSPTPGVHDAFAQTARRPKGNGGEEEDDSLLLVPPRIEQPSMLLAHRSHSSHSSHSSHRSHSSGGYVGGPSDDGEAPAARAPAPPPKPPPPKPAHVSVVAYPGGRIFVDGKLVGTDSTGQLTLQPGSYNIRVENRYVGDTTQTIRVEEGQTGIILVQW